MQRRELLKSGLQMGAGALLAAGTWPGRLRAAENGQGDGTWSFIQVNDLHFDEDACGPWFEKIVAAIKASAPQAEFCLIAGDLADDGKAEQYAGVRDTFKALGLPLYTTPGNHDHVTDDDRTAYDQFYPGQTNQVFTHRGWQIIGLDSSDGTRYDKTQIHPATFDWLTTHLPQLDRGKPTLIFTHFPLGEGVHYRPLNADALLERFLDFNVQAVFGGHWHGYTEKTWQHAVLTTDRCCSRVRDNHDGTKEKGWFVCTAADGRVTRRFVPIPAV